MFNKTAMFTFNNIITNFLKVRIDANIFSLLCFTLPLCELLGNFFKLISYFYKSMVKISHSVFFTLIKFANSQMNYFSFFFLFSFRKASQLLKFHLGVPLFLKANLSFE